MLDGRVYVVTGAAGGIGAATTATLIERGAAGIVAADLEAPAPTADKIVGLAGDVRDEAHAEDLVATALKTFGRLDGLVNNAGVVTLGPAWDLDPDDVRREFDVNVNGTFVTARAVGRVLAERGGGAIVNVASNCGKVGYPNMAAYNASKAAVINLTRSLATEWASVGVNVNAVCPGGVDTPMLGGVADWLSSRTGQDAATLLDGMGPAQLGRLVKPDEVARVIAWLLSDDALIVRGQAINVDGGDTPI